MRLPIGILTRPRARGHIVAQDGHGWRTLAVRRREGSASHDWQLERPEVVGVHRLEVERGVPEHVIGGLPVGRERREVPPARAGKRRHVHGRRGDNPRRCLEPADHVIEEADAPRTIVRVLGLRQPQPDEHQPVGGQTEIHALQLQEAARQQPRARHDHHSQRGLQHDERAPAAMGAPRFPVAPRSGAKVDNDVRPREPQGGRKAGERSRHERDRHREHRDPRIDAHRFHARQAVRDERDECRHRDPRRQDAGRATGDRQEHALGHDLSRHARSARAERGADGELARSRLAAHEQQVGEVGGGNQQHEDHRREQHEQRPAHVADDRLIVAAHDRHGAAGAVGRRGLVEAREEGGQLARGVLDGGAGPEPPDEVHVAQHPVAEPRAR